MSATPRHNERQTHSRTNSSSPTRNGRASVDAGRSRQPNGHPPRANGYAREAIKDSSAFSSLSGSASGSASRARSASSGNRADHAAGCPHVAAMSEAQLRQMMKRYALGIRWGKKVRRGAVLKPEEDEEERDGEDEDGGYGHYYQQQQQQHRQQQREADGHGGKRRKLLPHPECADCSATLHRPYLCLDCAYIGCFSDPQKRRPIQDACMSRHLRSSTHAFAFEIHSGHLYCCACLSGITDPRFELLFHRERGRISMRSVPGPAAEDDLSRLCQLPEDAISKRTPRGIHNLGATCFLSVILQSFLHNPLLRNFFLADRHNAGLCHTQPNESCMACEMDRMFREFFLYEAEKGAPSEPWTPDAFLYSVWRAQDSSELSQSGQQDSHELFISALNTLHNCLTAPGRAPATRKPEVPQWPNDNDGRGISEATARGMEMNFNPYSGPEESPPEFVSKLCDCVVHRAFAGVLQSDVRCLVCGYRSSTHDPVLDLSVDLRPPSLIAQQQKELQALLELDGSSIIENEGKKKKKKNADKDKDGAAGKEGGAGGAVNGKKSKGSAGGALTMSGIKNKLAEQGTQDLVECLRRYCTSEQLPPSSYSCPQCGPVEASKQLSLCRLPPVLCIQLKRFEHTPTSTYKIETKVRFPQRLDVQEFVTPSVLERGKNKASSSNGQNGHASSRGGVGVEEQVAVDEYVYDLFCVIVHEGTLNTGHYWCFCKWQDQWWKLNDGEARPAKISEVFKDAYQLVYVRTSLENVVCA